MLHSQKNKQNKNKIKQEKKNHMVTYYIKMLIKQKLKFTEQKMKKINLSNF